MTLTASNTLKIADIDAPDMPISVLQSIGYLTIWQDKDEDLEEHIYNLLGIPDDEMDAQQIPPEEREWIKAAADATRVAGCSYTRFININFNA